MIALGFDTSAAHCAAALVSGDAVLAHADEPMARGQAERLIPLIEDLLHEAGLAWRDVGVVGVGTGPGNFTGLRVAVAAARGLALGLDVRAVGVPAVKAYARDRGDVTVALPAPRGGAHVLHGAAALTLPGGATLPEGWPCDAVGPGADRLAGVTVRPAAPLAPAIASLAVRCDDDALPRPAPIYLRPADAAPAVDAPPTIIMG